MLVLRTSNFEGDNDQIDSSETYTLYCLYCSPLNFLPRAISKSILNYFQLLKMENFHEGPSSIRVFPADGHSLLIVSLR